LPISRRIDLIGQAIILAARYGTRKVNWVCQIILLVRRVGRATMQLKKKTLLDVLSLRHKVIVEMLYLCNYIF